MTETRRRPTRRRRQGGPEKQLAYLFSLFIIVMTVLDYADDGHVDKYWIGGVVAIALSGLGYRIDTIMEAWLDFKYARHTNGDDE